MKLRPSKHWALIIALMFVFSMFPGYGMAEDIQPSASLMETANPPLDIGEVSGNNQGGGQTDLTTQANPEDSGDNPGDNPQEILEDQDDNTSDNEREDLGNPIFSNAPATPALTTYTVSYVANGTSLREEKVVSDQAIGTEIVEAAVEIEGYTADEPTKSLKLTETGNVITFNYTEVEGPQEMPAAITLTATDEGTIVTLSADAGVLPAGTILSARLLPEEEKLDYLSALETEQGVTLNQSMAFDITLLDEQGNEIQPNGEVTVSFSNVEFVDANDEVLVYHFEPQEENAPKGKLASSPHKGKKIAGGFKISNKLARLYGKKVTFNTEHFSIYIVGTNIKHDNSQNRYIMNIGDTLTIEERDLSSGGTWSITKGGSLATLAVDSSNSRCAITAVATGNVTVRYRKSWWISNTDTFFYIQIALLDSHDTLTPAVVTPGNENAGEVTASKTAKWIDEENRIAEIEFSVKGVPLTSASDVILVMDVSGSMSDRIVTAKRASNEFIDELLGNDNPANNRVAFIPFSHGSEKGGASDTEVAAATKGSLNFSYDIDLLKKHVRSTEANGGTNYTAALQKAINYAASRYEDEQTRPLYVVFMSDGAPGLSGESPNDPNWNGTVQADTLRGSAYNATIYTVGIQLADGSSGVSALKNISSSDSNGQKLYQSVSNMDDLEPILQTIAGQIVNAGRDAVIKDVISEYFEYYNDDQYQSHGTYNETDKSVTISVGDITQNAKTYKIYVQLKDQYWNTNGSYPTNYSVLLTYTDIDGDPASNDGLGDPKVEVVANTDTAYKVNHYQEDLNADTYTLAETDNMTGTTGAQTEAAAKSYEGFTAQSFNQVSIAADGSTVVDIYYSRNSYTVTWIVDGTTATESYAYGATPNFKGSTDKAADAQYTYTFTGWTPAIVDVVGNATYTAEYSSTINNYTVTWIVDGTTATESYAYGATPNFKGSTDKAADAQYTYTFTGWTPEIVPVTGPATYTAQYTTVTNSYEVTFVDWNDNVLETQIVAYGNGATTPTDPSREGYTFTGWSEDFSNITEALTVKAQYNINSYQITYEAGANGTLTGGDRTDAKHYGDSYSPAPLPVPNNGYVFSHWTPALPGANDKITESKTFKAIFTLAGGGTSGGGGGGGGGGTTSTPTTTPATPSEVVVEPEAPLVSLNREDHYAYMVGYPDNTFRPEGKVTREEVATVFYKLLDEQSRTGMTTKANNFSDLEVDRWSCTPIATLAAASIITGYEDGTFRPGNVITRAELATIASKFDNLSPFESNKFSDVAGHWANTFINSAAQKGWVNGYEDGTFKPEQAITRAEFATLVNNVLDRRVKKENILPDAKQFSDLNANAWYYEACQEAINSHYYERENPSDFEVWTELYEFTISW